jgi:hypothetical protein
VSLDQHFQAAAASAAVAAAAAVAAPQTDVLTWQSPQDVDMRQQVLPKIMARLKHLSINVNGLSKTVWARILPLIAAVVECIADCSAASAEAFTALDSTAQLELLLVRPALRQLVAVLADHAKKGWTTQPGQAANCARSKHAVKRNSDEGKRLAKLKEKALTAEPRAFQQLVQSAVQAGGLGPQQQQQQQQQQQSQQAHTHHHLA